VLKFSTSELSTRKAKTVHLGGVSEKEIDKPTRDRLVAWLRHVEPRFRTRGELARQLDVSNATVSNLLNGKTTPGFDVFLKMHRGLHISADQLLDNDPPASHRADEAPNPNDASQPNAKPGRHGLAGGE
jgi:transcriptional regulator with XRE-family HTH domain